MNQFINLELTGKLDVPNVFVVYDKSLGWIEEYDCAGDCGNMCFMTHNRNDITQDDIDVVRFGILSVLV